MPELTKNISKNIITRAVEGICFGDVIYAPQGQYGPLVQQHFQLVLIVEGSLKMRVDGAWLEVPAGSVAPMLPSQELLLLFSRERPTRHQWCTVPGEHLSGNLARQLAGEKSVVPVPEVMHSIMRAGLQVESGTGAHSLTMIRALAEAVMGSFLEACDRERKKGEAGSEWVRRAQRFVEENWGEEMNLEDLARKAGVTPNHLIRLFREQLGITPMEYLWQARLDRGAVWLKETGLSVAEIAYRAGFQSPFHFSRRFKERFGKSPRAFRNRSGKEGGG